MLEAALYAWDYDEDEWVKVAVNSDGELLLTTE